MRTQFLATVAAALLTIGTASVAMAQAADIQATMDNDAISASNNSLPSVGFSAHYHPHGGRNR